MWYSSLILRNLLSLVLISPNRLTKCRAAHDERGGLALFPCKVHPRSASLLFHATERKSASEMSGAEAPSFLPSFHPKLSPLIIYLLFFSFLFLIHKGSSSSASEDGASLSCVKCYYDRGLLIIQGDHSPWRKPPVDNDLKLRFSIRTLY